MADENAGDHVEGDKTVETPPNEAPGDAPAQPGDEGQPADAPADGDDGDGDSSD